MHDGTGRTETFGPWPAPWFPRNPLSFHKRQTPLKAAAQTLHVHVTRSYSRLWVLAARPLQGALFSEFMLSSKGVTTNAAAGSGGAAGATAVNSRVTCAAPGFLWVRTVSGPRLWPACPAKGVSSILNVRSASPRRPGPPPTPAARLPPGSPCRSCGPAPFPHVPWESSCGQRL